MWENGYYDKSAARRAHGATMANLSAFVALAKSSKPLVRFKIRRISNTFVCFSGALTSAVQLRQCGRNSAKCGICFLCSISVCYEILRCVVADWEQSERLVGGTVKPLLEPCCHQASSGAWSVRVKVTAARASMRERLNLPARCSTCLYAGKYFLSTLG